MLMPGIGWVNGVPDAKAAVDFEIAGTKLAFEGVGYHDKVRIWWSLYDLSLIDVSKRIGAPCRSFLRCAAGTG